MNNPLKFIAISVAAFAAATLSWGQTTETFNANGTFTPPSGVTSVTIRAWGGGGGTRTATTNARGGGGGGAYAEAVIAVTPGNNYTVVVGAGGLPATDPGGSGGDSWFGSTSTVLAAGGTGGTNAGGAGGTVAASVGTVRYAGGNGGSRTDNGAGGGGGGSAFSTGPGGNGGNGGATTGGTAGDGEGDGGVGGNDGANGNNGNAPGGGGGGHGDNPPVGGSTGAPGRVTVTYTALTGGPATQIAFLTPPRTAAKYDLSDVITVELRDVSDVATASVGTTTINLGHSLAGAFRNTGDSATITQVTIPNGQSTASFRYRPSTKGTHILNAADNAAVLASDSQNFVATVFPKPIQTFYLPLLESQVLTYLDVTNTNADWPMQRYAGITANTDGTIIYYDQRENGYETVINEPVSIYSAGNPSGTQIWGDGNPANGYAPGYTDDILDAGTVIILNNAVNSGQPTAGAPLYGSGDKIASTKPIAITTTIWASVSDTLFTDAVEVYETGAWGTAYRLPVGANTPSSNAMFESTRAVVMAGAGGATINVNGGAGIALAEGESYIVGSSLNQGSTVTSNNPVQVHVLTSDIGSQYETRWFTLFPTAAWTSSYYSPVSTPAYSSMPSAPASGIVTTVWLHNPHPTNAITVTYERRGSANLISNVANGGNPIVPAGPTSFTSQPMTGSGYGNVYGPIVELNANGTIGTTPEGAWIGIVNRTAGDAAPTIETKVGNAMAAGAAAVIIVNEAGGATLPTGTAGTNRPIPVVGISQNDGASLRALGVGVGGFGWVRVSGDLVTSAVNVPANSTVAQVMDAGYGAHFFTESGDPFYAISTTDTTGDAANNLTWDWGFTLVPEAAATTQLLVGLGLGRDPTSGTNPNENGSPIWIALASNILGDASVSVYVDYDADPDTGPYTDPNSFKYDLLLTMKENEIVKIFDPSGNQTRMLIYTLNPDHKIVGAWGQDPLQSSVAQPGFDAGTGIPPLLNFVITKISTMDTDADTDGYYSPGDTIEYEVTIENSGRTPLNNINFEDTLPAAVNYVPGTAVFVDETLAVIPVADDLVPTVFPFDNGGKILPGGDLPVGGEWKVRYKAQIKPFNELPPGTVTLNNQVFVGSSGIELEDDVEDPIRGRIGDFVWVDTAGYGIQNVGETGLNGVTVRLLDENGFPALDDDSSPITTVTANHPVSGLPGYYQFLGIKAGNYIVEFVAPSGYAFSPQNVDSAGVKTGASNSDPDPLTGRTPVFALAGGESTQNIDAGLYESTLAVISAVRAVVANGAVVVEWDVEMELETAGYYLERWTGTAWVRVNAELIWAMPFLPAPKTYAQADPGAPLQGMVRYRIVELDYAGRLLAYGPYDLVIGGAVSYDQWAAGIEWNGADSGRDADGDADGATNFQEYLAGTNPLSVNSVLAITGIEPVEGGVRLTWTSVAGKTYAIEMTATLKNPFLAVATGIAATAPENAHVLPVDFEAVRNAFFRVRVGE